MGWESNTGNKPKDQSSEDCKSDPECKLDGKADTERLWDGYCDRWHRQKCQQRPTEFEEMLDALWDAWQPDYATLNIAVPVGHIPLDVQITRDYYGRWYFGAGLWVGSPGVSLFGGRILGGDIDQRIRANRTSHPSPQETENFILKNSVFAGGGFIYGLGGTWGSPFDGALNLSDFAVEGGATFPGFTAGWTYTETPKELFHQIRNLTARP